MDWFQRLVPLPDCCDDVVWISLPDEPARLLIMLFDEAVDGALEIDDGVEDAVLQAASSQLGKEALDGVEPRARCRHQMGGPARCLASQAQTLGCICVVLQRASRSDDRRKPLLVRSPNLDTCPHDATSHNTPAVGITKRTPSFRSIH